MILGYCFGVYLNTTSSHSNFILPPVLTVTPKLAFDRQVRSRILGWISAARVSLSRFTEMAKKPNRKNASTEPAQAEERIEAIRTEIAQAMIQRNALPKSASDEEKAAAAARQPGGHAAPHEEPAAPLRRTSVRPPMDRAAEEVQMDAANEEELFFERQQLEEEDRDGADELAHQRGMAEKKWKKEEAAKRREAEKREKKEAKAKAEAARLKVEKEAAAKIRQQGAEREARQHAAQDARSSGWFSEVLRQLKAFFGGSR